MGVTDRDEIVDDGAIPEAELLLQRPDAAKILVLPVEPAGDDRRGSVQRGFREAGVVEAEPFVSGGVARPVRGGLPLQAPDIVEGEPAAPCPLDGLVDGGQGQGGGPKLADDPVQRDLSLLAGPNQNPPVQDRAGDPRLDLAEAAARLVVDAVAQTLTEELARTTP